jgi:hypothetical protein
MMRSKDDATWEDDDVRWGYAVRLCVLVLHRTALELDLLLIRHEGSEGLSVVRIIKVNEEFEVVRQIFQVCFFEPLMVFVATVFDDTSDVRIGNILRCYHPTKEVALILDL